MTSYFFNSIFWLWIVIGSNIQRTNLYIIRFWRLYRKIWVLGSYTLTTRTLKYDFMLCAIVGLVNTHYILCSFRVGRNQCDINYYGPSVSKRTIIYLWERTLYGFQYVFVIFITFLQMFYCVIIEAFSLSRNADKLFEVF